MTDIRETLLDAAARLYAEVGYRGTTTRKIAQLADVNEITLFRHFGTKDDLLRAVLLRERHRVVAGPPPADAAELLPALLEWGELFHARIHSHRAFIRQVMGDASAHPHLAMDPCDGADHEVVLLGEWLQAWQARGEFAAGADLMTAAHLLVNALFTDAIWRDMAPVELMPPASVVVQSFVAFILNGLGYAGPLPVTPRTPKAPLVQRAKETA